VCRGRFTHRTFVTSSPLEQLSEGYVLRGKLLENQCFTSQKKIKEEVAT
jgi:hypothetical protein